MQQGVVDEVHHLVTTYLEEVLHAFASVVAEVVSGR